MKLVSPQERKRTKSGDVLQPERHLDPVIELRKSILPMREYIKEKAETGLVMTALTTAYYLRAVDGSFLPPPEAGVQAMMNLKRRVIEVEKSYQQGEPQHINARLNYAAEQVTDAVTISAQFPELQTVASETIAPVVEKVVAALEHSMEFGSSSAMNLLPVVVFCLQFVDTKGRGKELVKKLEKEIVEEWIARSKEATVDPDVQAVCLMNGIYLRILYPHRESELCNIMEKQSPAVWEKTLTYNDDIDTRFLGTILVVLSDAHRLVADEHGQIRAQIREPATSPGPALPQRPSV